MTNPSPAPHPPAEASAGQTAVHYEHSTNFASVLEQLGVSLLVSTYQAGKLLAVGTHEGKLVFSFHHFEQAMGVAIGPGCVAVGTRRQVWVLRSAPELAPRVEPAGTYDACFLTRTAHFTGAIHGHELAWGRDEELWAVNTLFSCLCVLRPEFSFVPRWQPPFVTALAAEDRCHLNGLAMENGQPRYVTALGACDTPGGWRPGKATGGCVLEVPSGRVVARGLTMPHSPRVHDGRLWVLDSGFGRLSRIDPASGQVEPVAHVPGYTRGLALQGPFAFVGLSRIRETAVFGGIPIAEHRDRLRCGVHVIDLRNGQVVAGLTFHTGVEEIFDVQLLPGVRCPVLSGPLPDQDGNQTIWLVPAPRHP